LRLPPPHGLLESTARFLSCVLPVLVFGVLVITIALLALVVWWLQRHERQNRLESIDRSGELPPLSTSGLPDFSHLQRPAESPTTATVSTPAATAVEPGFVLTPPIARGNRLEAASSLWQDQVKKLKDNGEFELALVLCQQQFPKAQAFQQAAILLRLQMKQLLEQQQDITPFLARLYRCAVLADLFRSGASHKPLNPRQALKALASHEFQYQDVGHRHLKLLSKSDSRLLEQRWGEPASHLHAEHTLGPLWENLCR
jgi:hypothetical protein